VILQLVGFAPVTVFLLLALPTLARMPLRELGFRAPTPRDVASRCRRRFAMVVLVNGSGHPDFRILAPERYRTSDRAAASDEDALRATAVLQLGLRVRAVLRRAYVSRLHLQCALALPARLDRDPDQRDHLRASPRRKRLGPTAADGRLPLAVGGIVLAYVYSVTKCFWANVITHALFNAVSVVSFYVFHLK
jgi:hypothetical protein